MPGPIQIASYSFARETAVFCKWLMEQKKEFVLSRQLMKSGTSIGANIEEAQQAQSRADFSSKLSIALKEAYESRFWLRIIGDIGYAPMDRICPLLKQADANISMLVRSIKTTKSNSKSGA